MFDTAAVNLHILEKSHLLQEARLDSAGAVLRGLVALDANSVEDAYFSLYLRTRSFNVQAFEKGLYQGTSMARVKGLKNYMQVIPREYLPAVYAVTKGDREAAAMGLLKTWGIAEDEYRKVSSKILESLDGKEKTLVQLKKDLSTVSRDIVRKKERKAMNVSIVARAMMDRWILLRGGIGRHPGENPGRFSTLKGRFKMKLDMGREAAISLLAGLYFKQYGPASASDLAWWLGITLNEASAAVDMLDEIEAVEIPGVRGRFFMLKKGGPPAREASPDHPVVFLPRDDPYVKAYYEEARFVPPGHHVMTKFGESASVVLIDGTVWGTWRLGKERLADVCSVTMFEGYPAVEGLKEKLERAASDACRFYTGGDVEVTVNV